MLSRCVVGRQHGHRGNDYEFLPLEKIGVMWQPTNTVLLGGVMGCDGTSLPILFSGLAVFRVQC